MRLHSLQCETQVLELDDVLNVGRTLAGTEARTPSRLAGEVQNPSC